MWQWEAVGRRPYFLQRHWEPNQDLPEVRLFRAVRFGKARTASADYRAKRLLATPPRSTAALARLPVDRRLAECSGLYAKYLANGRPKGPPTPWPRAPYPPLSFYQPHFTLQPIRHAQRWNLGEADTTGATHRPARQRTTMLAGGRRLVETRRSTTFYGANGRLEYQAQYGGLGRATIRGYYPDGRLRSEEKHGLLRSRTREWDGAGQLEKDKEFSRVGKHPGRAVRRKLKRLHPLRAVKQKLRRFHPMQPVYRTFRRAFGKDDHHRPPPGRP